MDAGARSWCKLGCLKGFSHSSSMKSSSLNFAFKVKIIYSNTQVYEIVSDSIPNSLFFQIPNFWSKRHYLVRKALLNAFCQPHLPTQTEQVHFLLITGDLSYLPTQFYVSNNMSVSFVCRYTGWAPSPEVSQLVQCTSSSSASARQATAAPTTSRRLLHTRLRTTPATHRALM